MFMGRAGGDGYCIYLIYKVVLKWDVHADAKQSNAGGQLQLLPRGPLMTTE